MRIDVFSIFPEMLTGFFGQSLLGRAQRGDLVDLRAHDLREHTSDVHRSVDDSPFGGGAGMVLSPEPIFRSVESAQPPRPLYLLGPGGRRFDQSAGTRASTNAFATTSAMASCRSATSC